MPSTSKSLPLSEKHYAGVAEGGSRKRAHAKESAPRGLGALTALLTALIALLVVGCGGENPPDLVSVTRERLTAVVQINSGGDERAPFASDKFFDGGNGYSVGAAVDTAGVPNAASPAVYQTERYGNFSYRILGLTPGNTYTVRLHFAEIYWGAAGKRLFNVRINGNQVLSNFDIFAAVGQNKALVRDFAAVAAADGQIAVQYTSVVDNAKSSAIEVLLEASNGPPTIASSAHATLDGSGATAALSALGADDGGEENLSYTWSTVGSVPAPVAFSANGSNAAKQVNATFSAAGNYRLQVTVRDQGGLTVTSTVDLTVAMSAPAAGLARYRINSGGPAVASFDADQFFSGGNTYSTSSAVSTSGVPNAAPAAVYQTERYGNHSYAFAGLTPNAAYTARLHFAEIHWPAAGKRVFNVLINGAQVLTNFDIYASCGGATACLRDFTVNASPDGRLLIDYRTVVDNAKSTAIEIIPIQASSPPAIATPAAASTNPVSGNTTSLSVLGTDDGGEGKLIYRWTTSGTPPAAVVFSTNGSNAAKNTTATFGKAGSYLLDVNVSDEDGQSVKSSIAVTVNQTLTSLELEPASTTVTPGGTKQFAVLAKDQFADGMPAPAVIWSVDGGGTIDSNGLFTASGSKLGQFTVTASTSNLHGAASVTIASAGAPAGNGSGSGTSELDGPPSGLNPTACANPGGTPVGKVSGTPGTWENITPPGVTLDPSKFNNDNFGVQDMLVDPARPSDAYAFICHQGVWKSTDYGTTWRKINTGKNGALVDAGKPWGAGIDSNKCRDPNTPPTLYTLSGGGAQGFLKSVDGGVNWERVELPPQSSTQYPQDAYQIAVNPYAGGHLLMGFHEAVGLLESKDGGSTWQVRTPADDGVSVYYNFVDTGNPATTAKTWLSIGQSGATFRTTDAGATWRRVELLTHAHGSSQIFQAGNGVIYVPGMGGSDGNGVYRSTDYGVTFKKVMDGITNSVIGTPTTLYSSYAWASAGTVEPNLHIAPRNPGTAWTRQTAPAGMTNGAKGAAVTTDGTHHIVLTGNWNAGIWRYIEP